MPETSQPSKPTVKTVWTVSPIDGHSYCQHGDADDMHCCQCRRRGFLLAFEGEGGMKHKPGCFYYEIPEEKRDD